MRLEYTPQTFQRNLGELTQTDVNILLEQRKSIKIKEQRRESRRLLKVERPYQHLVWQGMDNDTSLISKLYSLIFPQFIFLIPNKL